MNLKAVTLLLVIAGLTGCDPINLKQSGTDLNTIVAAQQRANAAYENEDWSTAEREYRYLTQNVSGDAEPWFRLGNIYARTGKLDVAVAAYREALVRDPKSSKAWHNLGIVQLRQASNTFTEMQEYIAVDDPLRQRSVQVLNSMDTLLSGFGGAAPE